MHEGHHLSLYSGFFCLETKFSSCLTFMLMGPVGVPGWGFCPLRRIGPQYPLLMRTSEDRSGPLVTCTGNPCQSTGTSSPVSTGDLPVLAMQVTHGPDQSSEVLIVNGDKYGQRSESFTLRQSGKSSLELTGC